MNNVVATLVIHESGAVSAYYMNGHDCVAYRQFHLGENYIRYQYQYRLKIVGAISKWDSENQWRNYYDLQDMHDEFIIFGSVPEDKLIQYNPRAFVFTADLISIASISHWQGLHHDE